MDRPIFILLVIAYVLLQAVVGEGNEVTWNPDTRENVNLLNNGGFEKGKTGWKIQGRVDEVEFEVVEDKEGKYALITDKSDRQTGITTGRIPVFPNSTYLLEGKVLNDISTEGSARIKCNLWDLRRKVTGGPEIGDSDKKEWVTFSSKINTGENWFIQIDLLPRGLLSKNKGRAMFDDIRLMLIKKGEKPPRIKLDSRYNIEKKELKIEVDVSQMIRDLTSIETVIERYSSKKKIDQKYVEIDPETRVGTTVLKFGSLPEGKYTIVCKVMDMDGKVIEKNKISFTSSLPHWWNAEYDHSIPPPWSPLEIKGNDIKCFNRVYTFKNSIFPEKILSNKVDVLKSPILFKVNGNSIPFIINVEKKSEEKIIFKGVARRKDFNIIGTSQLYFDGVIKTKIELLPKSTRYIDSLRIEIPLNSNISELFHYNRGDWAGADSGAVKEDFSISWRPYVWIGNEEAGLCWFSSSQRGWYNNKKDEAINILKKDKETLIVLNIIDKRFEVKKKMEYSFGFQATPVRLPPKRWRDWHTVHGLFFGAEDAPWPANIKYRNFDITDPKSGTVSFWFKPIFETNLELSKISREESRYIRPLFKLQWEIAYQTPSYGNYWYSRKYGLVCSWHPSGNIHLKYITKEGKVKNIFSVPVKLEREMVSNRDLLG